jgi:hypothetical protein
VRWFDKEGLRYNGRLNGGNNIQRPAQCGTVAGSAERARRDHFHYCRDRLHAIAGIITFTRATTNHYPKCYAHQRRSHFFSALLLNADGSSRDAYYLIASTDDADVILAYPPISGCWSYSMSRLPLRTLDDAPDGAKKGLELSQKANGFLPNLVRLLANAPIALEAYQTLSAINARSGLRLAELRGRSNYGGRHARLWILRRGPHNRGLQGRRPVRRRSQCIEK